MALVSPGVEVTIIDQSQYLAAAPASVPLILLATAQNKANAANTGIAVATTAANANKLYRVTSQRDLVTLYGNPFFYKTTNGVSLQGYELNEYGLLAAYSVLGTTNLCYVLRADIDLASLVGRTSRPLGEPNDGTYWMNTGSSRFGLLQFNQSTGNFVVQTPLVITDMDDLTGSSGAPLASIGNIGDYAVTFTTDANNFTVASQPDDYHTYWFKNLANDWVAVGSPEWRLSWPTVQGTEAPVSLTAADSFDIDYGAATVTITVPAGPNNDVDGIVSEINAALIPFITAANVDGKLEIYCEQDTSFEILNGVGTVLTQLGIEEMVYWAPAVVYGTNAQQPLWRLSDTNPHPTGSLWIKTNAANSGTNLQVSQYSAATAEFSTVSCPLGYSDWTVIYGLDSAGGQNIATGTLYAQYSFGDSLSEEAPLMVYRKANEGPAVFTGDVQDPVFAFTLPATSANFEVQVSVPGSSSLSAAYPITIDDGDTATIFVTKWAAAGIPNTTAAVVDGYIQLTHTAGGVIILDDLGDPDDLVAQAGFSIGPLIGDCTPGAKWGPYKEVTEVGVTQISVVPSGGLNATFDVTSLGYDVVSIAVNNGGTGYNVDDVITLADNIVVKVTAETGNVITAVEWISGQPFPQYTVQLSNWIPLSYVPSSETPAIAPTTGTNWYYSVATQADILTNKGGEWFSYREVAYASNGLPQASGANVTDVNGPIFSPTAPEALTGQSDGTALEYGDLWIDTSPSGLENYPVIYRWQDVDGLDQWVLIDNNDQTTENGIVFADARWGLSGSVDPVFDAIPSIQSLLTGVDPASISGAAYLDLDAPDANLFPQGTLLFNTRRSGYNVKQFVTNYFNNTRFPGSTLPAETSAWVSISGNIGSGSQYPGTVVFGDPTTYANGAPYMGRKAQRSVVVQALKAAVDTNTQVREEDTFFNLMACPNYPELQPNMVVLNNDRNETAYIIGDTPMRLPAEATPIFDWAANTAGALSTGEEGLVTRNTYMGLYYPSGVTNDLTGSTVVVPPSHMILRTMVYNDTVAYPWFAPAGQRRGIVDNATNIGYIDATTGEFETTKNSIQLRDVEYTNFINPIAYFTNIGILNFGNKNSFDSQSALDRTNVARLICYIRWNLQAALRPFIFEPNDSITRNQARSIVQTLLADIQSKRGLYDYVVVCDESNNTPARIDRNELWVDVAIEPVKAAEFIYVPVRILNTGEIAGLGLNG